MGMGASLGMRKGDINHALQILGLSLPITRERLAEKRRELLATWHPHRYANLTNNPRKYMQMYTKGEAMTKEIEEAYLILAASLVSGEEDDAKGGRHP